MAAAATGRGRSRARLRSPSARLEAGHSRQGTMHDVLKKLLRFRFVSHQPGRGLPRGDVRPRRAAGDAHRIGQIARATSFPASCSAGTTLVMSPLIALMEDQIAKLQSHRVRRRTHPLGERPSDITRSLPAVSRRASSTFCSSRRSDCACAAFPEMLAKRKPCLIAIDEAHCISAWGHDFRPDYRTIGQHLPALRPAPVIALTATATPIVQRDIAQQLGLSVPRDFIQGFRRDNIAIEVARVPPSARFERVVENCSRF